MLRFIGVTCPEQMAAILREEVMQEPESLGSDVVCELMTFRAQGLELETAIANLPNKHLNAALRFASNWPFAKEGRGADVQAMLVVEAAGRFAGVDYFGEASESLLSASQVDLGQDVGAGISNCAQEAREQIERVLPVTPFPLCPNCEFNHGKEVR